MKTNYAISGELFFKISILENSLRHHCYLHFANRGEGNAYKL